MTLNSCSRTLSSAGVVRRRRTGMSGLSQVPSMADLDDATRLACASDEGAAGGGKDALREAGARLVVDGDDEGSGRR